MNRGDIDFHSVQYHNSGLQHSRAGYPFAPSIRPLSHSDPEYAGDVESVSTAETVLRWETPLESRPTNEHAQSEATLKPLQSRQWVSSYAPAVLPKLPLERDQLHRRDAPATERGATIFDEFDSAPPTPNGDNTHYIVYAIDQLTRDPKLETNQRPATETTLASDETYPVERIIPDQGLGYVQSHHGLGRLQSVKKVQGPAVVDIKSNSRTTEFFLRADPRPNSQSNPDLTFRPQILRSLSMRVLLAFCLLMVVALIACASYSSSNRGLVAYTRDRDLTGAQYFVFQFLPQILAAVLQFYVEAVISVVARILPFAMMASDDARRRSNALFVGLYSTSLFLPRFDYLTSGEPILGICSIFLWPLSLAIPLQSCLFSVIYVDGVWRWTAVQGVAWTLVAIYTMALISLVGIAISFSSRVTGLIWDPRSLADIIALLSRSNSLAEYHETEVMLHKNDLRDRLAVTAPRLGYWRMDIDDKREIFHCIGVEGSHTRGYTLQAGRPKRMSYSSSDAEKPHDLEAGSSPTILGHRVRLISRYSPSDSRYQYIPWYLKASRVVLWPVAAFFLLLALLLVCFLPSTALNKGFRPLVPAAPNSTGYSPANFLYSFIPSVIGILIYSSFRSFFLMICRLTPWRVLSRTGGATASESLLVDYTAPFPLLSALANKHWLVALLSILSVLNILVPVLAGGLLFAFELLPSETIVMLPNLPAFYVILPILILNFVGLVYVMMHVGADNTEWCLPHPVSCLAEIISFIYASGVAQDAAFRAVRSKADLRARLIGRRERALPHSLRRKVRYAFGIFRDQAAETHIGVQRLGNETWRRGTYEI